MTSLIPFIKVKIKVLLDEKKYDKTLTSTNLGFTLHF